MKKTLVIDMNKIDTELFKTTGEKKIIGTIPAGTSVNVIIDKDNPTKMTIEGNDISIKTRSSRWNNLFKKNGKIPSEKTIEKWVYDSVCKSLNGANVEPDGWDSNGSPSWLLALGMI